MPYQFSSYFPPLRRKILKSFLFVIASYILLGIFLVGAVFFASSLTPTLIHVNYDSISAAGKMKEAWIGLHHPEEYSHQSTQQWIQTFEEALVFEEGNITEPGEKEITAEIRKLWDASKMDPLRISSHPISEMSEKLDQLVALNEKGMFGLASQSQSLSRKIFIGSLLFFFITLILTMLLADNLSYRLAKPIKDIAEVLRNKPALGNKLKLPAPTTLELSILSKQLTELWDQLGSLDKLNLKQLVAQRNQLETVLSSVEDGILVLNHEEKVVLCNEGMARIFEMEPQEILHASWKDLPTLHENYLRLRSFLTSELFDLNSIELEVAGLKMIFAARYRIILDDQNHPIGSLYLLHDITQKLRMQRMKEEFISVLSHELKTPIQSLGTAAELLANRREKMDADSQILIETLNEDVSRIRAIANDFIQIGQRSTPVLKLHLTPVLLGRALQEWIKPFRLIAKDKNIRLEMRLPPEEIWANLDEVKFPWVISNLLSNAIRISPPDTQIQISLCGKDEKIYFEVLDEGPGVPPEIEKNIFEPYYQGEGSASSKLRGFLGIGLTIAKEVVEAHEGKIEYQPREPTGSIFRIELPKIRG